MKIFLLLIISIFFLHFLGKLSFFKGVQLGTKKNPDSNHPGWSQGYFGSERRKSTKKELFATIIMGS